MLKAVTKRFTDNSTLTRFEFEFYCDCCGRPLLPVMIEPQFRFKKKLWLTRDEREARAIIYANDHSRAYERANHEMRHELNRCEACGEMVCEDCTVYGSMDDGGICCKRCAEKRKNKTEKENHYGSV